MKKGIYDLVINDDESIINKEDFVFEKLSDEQIIQNKDFFCKQIFYIMGITLNNLSDERFVKDFKKYFSFFTTKKFNDLLLLKGVGIKADLIKQLDNDVSNSTVLDSLCTNKSFFSDILTSDFIKLCSPFITKNILDKIIKQLYLSPFKNKLVFKILTTTFDGRSKALDIVALKQFYNSFVKNFPKASIEIKIEDVKRISCVSRLHAKIYSFNRSTNFGNIYIGSSNLTKTGLDYGKELNVKISEFENKLLFDNINNMFDSYWNNITEFVDIKDEIGIKRLIDEKNIYSLEDEKIANQILKIKNSNTYKLEPTPYQLEALKILCKNRKMSINDNLIVMATGTGKTFLAINDYKNIKEELKKGYPSMLFIAHQKVILDQAAKNFKSFFNDNNFKFSKLYSNDDFIQTVPDIENDNVIFASIQSLLLDKNIEKLKNRNFDVVYFDEAHHISPNKWQVVTKIVKNNSKYFTGLTATPELSNGFNIKDIFFGGKIAYEIRLWDAISNEILAPFDYFLLNDDSVDLSMIKFKDDKKIGNLLSNDERNKVLLNNIKEKITMDEKLVRAVVFCQNKKHSESVNGFLLKNGKISCVYNSDYSDYIKKSVLDSFKDGKINYLIVVDMLNEGVDIPQINVLILARPTQSLTIFIQQLGRGLRKFNDKKLQVLDFVYNINNDVEKSYNPILIKDCFASGQSIDFEDESFLPPGCTLSMDLVARDKVLKSMKYWAKKLAEKAKRMGISKQYFNHDNNVYTYKDYKNLVKKVYENINEMYVVYNGTFFTENKSNYNGEKGFNKYSSVLVNCFLYLNHKQLIEEFAKIIETRKESKYDIVNQLLYQSFFSFVDKCGDEQRKLFKKNLSNSIDDIFKKEFSVLLKEIYFILKYKLEFESHFLLIKKLENDTKCLIGCYFSQKQYYSISGLYYRYTIDSIANQKSFIKKQNFISACCIARIGNVNGKNKFKNEYKVNSEETNLKWYSPTKWNKNSLSWFLNNYKNCSFFIRKDDFTYNGFKVKDTVYKFIGKVQNIVKIDELGKNGYLFYCNF